MGRALIRIHLPGSAPALQAAWLDTGLWPAFVDGCASVTRVDGPWPHETAEVEWVSVPLGRGEVVEIVTSYEPGRLHISDVRDSSLHGTQTVTFNQTDDGVDVQLELEYRLNRHTIFTPLFDLFFVRRSVSDSLERTLQRFEEFLAQGVNEDRA
jgi:hypothetical protein